MKKLKLDELQRDSLQDYKAKDKIKLLVVLDSIRSGMNVGSVFRTADCFGIEKVILCGISPQPPHKEIFKTAIGAQESVDWEYKEDIVSVIKSLKGDNYTVLGIEQTNESVSLTKLQLDKSSKIAVIMGNEVDGLNDNVLPLLDHAVEIEQFGTKHSLNVSVCAGVVLWEISRKMRR